MEMKQRIDTCLTDLERKRDSVATFQVRVKHFIDTLKSEGMTPGSLADLLSMLESVLKDYEEISASCQQMIVGLREIGDHLTRIEDGRQKILTGVESILQNLSHLDRLAQNGMQVGTTTGKSPKRILLVRISPEAKPPATAATKDETDEEDGSSSEGTVVH